VLAEADGLNQQGLALDGVAGAGRVAERPEVEWGEGMLE
jgi:hypothetical protein